MIKNAVLSADDSRRYLLSRMRLDFEPGRSLVMLWILVNPSVADHRRDDPTSKKVDGFSYRHGHRADLIVNPWPLRATDPKELHRAIDRGIVRLGEPENVAAIRWALAIADTIAVGWGNNGNADVEHHIQDLLVEVGRPRDAVCLGYTKMGQPLHPLMVSYETPLQPWCPSWTSENARRRGLKEVANG